MRRHWIFICAAACLAIPCLTAVGAGETYQLVSREFTVGVGEATSSEHVRTVVSREYTVGVGEESIDVWPAVDCLVGPVTLSNGCQFLRDAAAATLAWRIVGPDGRQLAAGQGVPLDEFAYQWNTHGLPDGRYTVFFTVSRPGQGDAAGSRDYQLVNDGYPGDVERVLTISLQRGWNLVALPYRVELADASGLFAQHPMPCGSVVKAYLQAGESLPAGCALWVHSEEEQELPITTRHASDLPAALPKLGGAGWHLTGLCGDEPLVVDCNALGITAIWRWNGFALEEEPIATTGLAWLEPHTGYFLEVK